MEWLMMTQKMRTCLARHTPDILTWTGIAGMAGAAVMAVRATPEAMARVEEKRKKQGGRELTVVEKAEAAWKCYLPAAVTGALSAGCLVAANTAHGRRSAALAAACGMSETALREYREKTREVVGEKKDTAIREAVDRALMEKSDSDQEKAAGSGSTLCYDTLLGRYFYSDMETIRSAVNTMNYRMTTGSETYVSLNELYMELGLPPADAGDLLGWYVSRGLVEVSFTTQLARGSTPCLVMTFATMPEYRYSQW